MLLGTGMFSLCATLCDFGENRSLFLGGLVVWLTSVLARGLNPEVRG